MNIKGLLLFPLFLSFVAGIDAQEVDVDGIKSFVNEMMSLGGEHVECEIMGYDEILGDIVKQIEEQTGDDVSEAFANYALGDSQWQAVLLTSSDEEGYNAIYEFIDKYDITVTEELFGIPLTINQREEGSSNILFTGNGHTLKVEDDVDSKEVSIIYSNCNIMDVLRQAMMLMMCGLDEDMLDIEDVGDFYYSFSFDDSEEPVIDDAQDAVAECATGSDVLSVITDSYNRKINSIQSRLNFVDDEEQREELMGEISDLREEMEDELENMQQEIAQLDEPSFVEISSTGEYFLAIPTVTEEMKQNMKPYALCGVYDWINSTGFCKGASLNNFDQISCIVTPRDVAMQYAIRHYPRNQWYDDGFSAEYKAIAVSQYQGGTPAVLYRFSQSETGYNDMLCDLGFLFELELGAMYRNLEVTQQSVNNGNRFVQLWGEGGVLMCLIDVPTEKYCHMSIMIGGTTGFEQAVNNYNFSGETGFAEKCNIIIDSDLSNGSYGIHFTDDEYFYAGKLHRNGVHIDFRYFEKYTR